MDLEPTTKIGLAICTTPLMHDYFVGIQARILAIVASVATCEHHTFAETRSLVQIIPAWHTSCAAVKM